MNIIFKSVILVHTDRFVLCTVQASSAEALLGAVEGAGSSIV